MAQTQARLVLLCTGLILAWTVGGCAPAQQKTGTQLSSEDVKSISEREKSAGHDETAELLRDGFVDKGDYDKAFANLERCMTDLGYTVTEPLISPADGLSFLFEYGNPGRAQDKFQSDSLECETKFWAVASAVYLNTTEQVTEEAVRVAAIECMNKKGFDVPQDAKNFKAMSGDPTADGGEQRKQATTCILDNVYRLHPNIRSVGLSN